MGGLARKPRDAARFGSALRLLGERIADRRRARDWSQERLAEASGLTLNTIGKIERADGCCSLETLFVVAAALEMEVSELVHGLDGLISKSPQLFTE